jgi:predicted outer membrane repeat protein
VDTNCDGVIPLDEFDGDNDTFIACAECDDDDDTVFPGAPELCDGLDNDCDTFVPADEVDADDDGWLACEDCDDDDVDSFPSAPELCDGLDNDCDGAVPADETTDFDIDGWFECEDCDDTDAGVNPGAVEVCEGVDTDCDGVLLPDELIDVDLDGYPLCDDCDDDLATVNPGEAEACDGLDTDCDGSIPATETDDDGDTYIECDGTDCDDTDITVYLGAPEGCYDAVDNNCDTTVNEGCTCPIWGALTAPGGCVTLGTYECPYVGAQIAIDATGLDAGCPDTWLKPGTYAENLVVEYGGSLAGPGPASAVVLDGGGNDRTLEIDTTSAFEVASLTITGGSASEGGGLLAEDTILVLVDLVFDSNVCTSGGNGGALHCDECTLSVTDSTFTGNDCGFGGSDSDNDGGAIFLTGGGSSFIAGNTFFDNTAGDGAAIRAGAASTGLFHVITQNLFQENDSSDSTGGFFEIEGGAVLMKGARISVTNNIFFANTATQGGGAITLTVGAGSFITNNVFVYNESGSGEGAGVHIDSLGFGGQLSVYNNIAAFNLGFGIYAELTLPSNMGYNAYHSNSSGGYGTALGLVPAQTGNVNADPQFGAVTDDGVYTNDDLTLQSASPCIDTGNPAVRYNDPDGTPNDMGAYGGINGNW